MTDDKHITPPEPSVSIWRQIYRHRLSLISLLVAITSLGYNTWRNEATEAHRNTREAAFQILLELGELEQIVSYRHYFASREDVQDLSENRNAEWVRGWGKVALIENLSQLMPDSTEQAGRRLKNAWQEHAARLELGPGSDRGKAAEVAIDTAIEETRQSVLTVLNALE